MRIRGTRSTRTTALLGCFLITAAVDAYPMQDATPAIGEAHASAAELLMAEEVAALLNEERAAQGLRPLILHSQVSRLAYQHSVEMAAQGTVGHHSLRLGVSTATRVKLAFPRILQFAENVAVNQSPERLHRALLVSTGHRLNRLDPDFTHVGIGVARASEHQVYLTEVFIKALDPTALDSIYRLYSTEDVSTLPQSDAVYGRIAGETVRIGARGPDDPEYWTNRGIDAYAAGRYAAAVEAFEKALEVKPDYDYARFNLARALIGNDNPQRALEVLSRIVQETPEDDDAWSSIGTAALLVQDYRRAEMATRRVLQIRPRDASSWYNLGLSLEMQERLDDAGAAYSQAVHLDSSLTQARVALARVRRQ